MIGIKREFSRRELLWFGPLFAMFGGLTGGLATLKFGWDEGARWIWIMSSILIVFYYLFPRLRKGIFTSWMVMFFPVGWILSHVLLAVVFYLVVFPIGMLLRLFGHDALNRRLDRDARSYWIRCQTGHDRRRYFRQF